MAKGKGCSGSGTRGHMGGLRTSRIIKASSEDEDHLTEQLNDQLNLGDYIDDLEHQEERRQERRLKTKRNGVARREALRNWN